ncbi:cilia- and flagella-associated protein 44-like [Protobothrops mucrosquamatus]|uniref:cilia- and flagella-associated protein 44-like n=1 Tax=Protobothrops mucrosquamatus TaxID=103944 RepID=UPI000775C57A|nr:cilia- and flagella-associated protein 44-like [Protobothrops mucrosquamatus]
MEPSGEQEGDEAKDTSEKPEEVPTVAEQQPEEIKEASAETKSSPEGEEGEKLAEDEYEEAGSAASEEEEPPPEPEKTPEPVKKKKKEVVEKKISENFYYNYEELCSYPYITPDSGIPVNLLSLMHSFGYDCTRRANLQMLDSQILLYIAGSQLVLLDLKSNYQRYLRSTGGGGIGVITV